MCDGSGELGKGGFGVCGEGGEGVVAEVVPEGEKGELAFLGRLVPARRVEDKEGTPAKPCVHLDEPGLGRVGRVGQPGERLDHAGPGPGRGCVEQLEERAEPAVAQRLDHLFGQLGRRLRVLDQLLQDLWRVRGGFRL